ncbi:MAG TPA: MazG nucleotide pyrophosphohydrolase domain-containing protein [Candidatus Hydrogenedentes bacterium]|nr:MazG nucleotide pyrophosphohydrolase domain-containing protein [Candidatus Hydrogenedentota bacterium]
MPLLPHLEKEPENEREWFAALISMARYLRGPEGCPWDRQQKTRDFARFAIEEGQELHEAAEADDNDHIEEELGDCLFTLLACAAAAEEEGRLTLEGAMRRIHEKMVRRHGHVFGDEKAATPEEAVNAWNHVKAREKGR